MPCMKATSAGAKSLRAMAIASSSLSSRVGWPGAPGCTIGACWAMAGALVHSTAARNGRAAARGGRREMVAHYAILILVAIGTKSAWRKRAVKPSSGEGIAAPELCAQNAPQDQRGRKHHAHDHRRGACRNRTRRLLAGCRAGRRAAGLQCRASTIRRSPTSPAPTPTARPTRRASPANCSPSPRSIRATWSAISSWAAATSPGCWRWRSAPTARSMPSSRPSSSPTARPMPTSRMPPWRPMPTIMAIRPTSSRSAPPTPIRAFPSRSTRSSR